MLKSLNNYFNHVTYRIVFLLLIALIVAIGYAMVVRRENKDYDDLVRWSSEGCWSYNTFCRAPESDDVESCIKKTNNKTPFYIRDKVYVPYAMCPKPLQVLPPK